MSILIFLIVLYIGNSYTMMKLFEKAGIPAQKAWVPGVAAMEWCKMVGRKPSYALWLFFPIVNFFIYAGLCIDMIRSFGKHGFFDSVLAVVFAPLKFFQIGNNPNDKYTGPVLDQEKQYHRDYVDAMEKKDKLALSKLESNNLFRKSTLREWAEAIIFAVFAAAFIRMFIFEAYVIPTPSMEGTLKVGDFLFVSKPSYGLRLPMTVIQFPLIHNRFSTNKGILGRESYLESPSLPYTRLPGWEQVERNKPVVFNFPAGDSVIITPDRNWDVYQWRREPRNNGKKAEVITRPLDKKDHYIKRCVAIPGDSLFIRGAQLYINGQPAMNPTHMQYMYHISSKMPLDYKKIDSWGVSVGELMGDQRPKTEAYFSLDAQQMEKMRALSSDIQIERYKPYNTEKPNTTYVYPNNAKVSGGWTVDDYGPIYIPKAGATVALDERSIVFYGRLIKDYEHNDFKIVNGKYIINGQEATTYTFKQDYYWMMGDNRHNSEDSRIWGYVPADHIVGKPILVWFSTKNGSIANGINWDRLFLFPGSM
jgi:signal peptidase I